MMRPGEVGAVVRVLSMTATQTPTTQDLMVLDPNDQDQWMTVHRNGCSHIRKAEASRGWVIPAQTSLEQAAAELGHDFIAEGSMTLEDCVDQITWAPCVKLPRAAGLPTPSKARKARKLAAVPDPTPAEEPTPRPALKNSERRNETTHPDGAAAVAHGKCQGCGARKGRPCTSKAGAPTQHVHAARMKAWEAAGGTPTEVTPELWQELKASRRAATSKAAK